MLFYSKLVFVNSQLTNVLKGASLCKLYEISTNLIERFSIDIQ